MSKPETIFRNGRVLPFLKTLQSTWFFSITQVAKSGDPDFILCTRGYYISLELKARGGVPTELQEYKLEMVTKCGGISLIADPDNWGEIKTFLKALDGGEYGQAKVQVPIELQFHPSNPKVVQYPVGG